MKHCTCGVPVGSWDRECWKCGRALVPGEGAPETLHAKTIVRTYRGHQQSDVVKEFKRDAARLSEIGYIPTSQSWAAGQWGGGAWLAALLLCVILLGTLIFIYMIIVKPEGTLTVTYSLDGSAARPQEPVPSVPASPQINTLAIDSRLRNLADLHANELIDDAEWAARRGKILDEI